MTFLTRPAALLVLISTLLIYSCAGLQPGYESPSVSVTSLKAIPGKGMAPTFEIGLHIVNPNRTALALKGAAYTISLEDHKLLTGVANDLPVIEPYGKGDLVLQGNVDLLSSLSFFADLARNSRQESVSYKLDAKLDVGALRPVIRVTKTGKLSLAGPVPQ